MIADMTGGGFIALWSVLYLVLLSRWASCPSGKATGLCS